MPVLRELLPCPLPFPELRRGPSGQKLPCCRAVQKRRRAADYWKSWANEAVFCLNELYGHGSIKADQSPSAGQLECLEELCQRFREFGSPDPISAAEAHREFCGSRPGYEDPGPRVTFQRELVSLPPAAGTAPLEAVLQGSAATIWKDWERAIRCSDAAAAAEQRRLGIALPHVDPVLQRRPRVYAAFIGDMYKIGLVKFSHERKPTLGPLVVAKKNGKQRLVLVTMIVNMRFRDPGPTVLPS